MDDEKFLELTKLIFLSSFVLIKGFLSFSSVIDISNFRSDHSVLNLNVFNRLLLQIAKN